MKVKDKVIVITGASSGIGRAAAREFARRGAAAVVLAARGPEALESAADECREHGAQALAVPTDVTDAAAVEALARRADERFGRIDVWVNCAAVTVFGPFTETPLEDFRRVLDVNVMGYVHGARAALPRFRERGRGVLVNVGSVAGVVPQPYAHAYAMSKFAVRALGASLRQELRLEGSRGIDVVTVLPATFDTPLFQHAGNYTGRRVRAMPPVYPTRRAARVIAGAVRKPRREVLAGTIAGNLLTQAKLAPGLTERLMAVQVDRTHLSKKGEPAEGPGTLYEPAPGPGSAGGGWHGGRKTAVRRALTAAAVAGAVVYAGFRYGGGGARRPGSR